MYKSIIWLPNNVKHNNVYTLHQLLWDLFPYRDKNDRNWIFRCDLVDGRLRIELNSQDVPRNFGLDMTTKVVPESFFQHDKYFFKTKLYAHERRNNRKNKQRIKTTYADANRFIIKRIENKGFEIINMNNISFDEGILIKKNHSMWNFLTVEYTGVLYIDNIELFKTCFYNGIGKTTWGNGLLMLKPIRKG